MTGDPQVDLIFSHFIPRYEATGVDPNDLRALMATVDHWEDWCRCWSEAAERHERIARDATRAGRALTAAEAYVRAAIYYHYGKHLFADHPVEFRQAHDAMLLADATSGPCDYVVYEEGNHVCFNISYKFRPLRADWTAAKLLA